MVVLVADQVTKSLAVDHLSGHPRHLLGPIGLDLTYNRGIAFSLGTGLTWPIVVIGALVVVALVVVARRAPSRLVATGLGLVLGGALGNLADRLGRGHGGAVVDFIHVGIWPTFNLADSAIVCGCGLLGWSLWRRSGGEPATPRRRESLAQGASTSADDVRVSP